MWGTVCGLAPGGRSRPAICKHHRLPTPDEVIVGLGLAVVLRAVGGGHVFQYCTTQPSPWGAKGAPHQTGGNDGRRETPPQGDREGRRRHLRPLRRLRRLPAPDRGRRSTRLLQPRGPDRVPGALRAEMLKIRVAHGYCSRQLAAEACPTPTSASNATTTSPPRSSSRSSQAQLADVTALRDDAAGRGWHTEVARHSRVIASLQAHLHRLKPTQEPDIKEISPRTGAQEAAFELGLGGHDGGRAWANNSSATIGGYTSRSTLSVR